MKKLTANILHLQKISSRRQRHIGLICLYTNNKLQLWETLNKKVIYNRF